MSKNKITIENLLEKIKNYNPEEIEKVKKAYDLANKLHESQIRESGEPYIIHPLNVTFILASMYADGDTLCAGLLHDVVEDTEETIEQIEEEFGSGIAHLVLGVTKINNLHFNSNIEATTANLRRIITSIDDDVRIIIIKLADRLHNMRTLEFKRPEKQKSNARETLEIYVPVVYFLGAYRLKCELEDLCMKYLYENEYIDINNTIKKIEEDYQNCFNLLGQEIRELLNKNKIKYESRFRVINPYSLLKKLNKKYELTDIHDLVNYKIIVNDIRDCYQVLGLIHSKYTPVHYKFKDYIAAPKTNMYSSLHTTIFGPDEKMIQIQIRTKKMDNMNTFGLTSYWRVYKGKGPSKMQKDLKDKFQFFKSLDFLNNLIENNEEYLNKIKTEVFTNNIYVYTSIGEVVELPVGSTAIDFAYKIHTEIGNKLVKVLVNGKTAPINVTLKSKDRIRIITGEELSLKKEWLEYAKTTYAQNKIKESLSKML